jgi:hypothetical protein
MRYCNIGGKVRLSDVDLAATEFKAHAEWLDRPTKSTWFRSCGAAAGTKSHGMYKCFLANCISRLASVQSVRNQ